MDVELTTGAITRARFQSNHHHRHKPIPAFCRPDAIPVAQPTVRAQKWKISHHRLVKSGNRHQGYKIQNKGDTYFFVGGKQCRQIAWKKRMSLQLAVAEHKAVSES